jgi:hypothetical protein
VHFETHGTPVMMGGGNLAFTVLGVDWNESTGEVRLIVCKGLAAACERAHIDGHAL